MGLNSFHIELAIQVPNGKIMHSFGGMGDGSKCGDELSHEMMLECGSRKKGPKGDNP